MNTNYTINERIFNIADIRNINNAEMARRLNTSPQQIANWKKGGRAIPYKYVVLFIEEFQDIDARWILTGVNYTTEKEQLMRETINAKEEVIKDKERSINIMEKYIKLLEK